MKLAVSNIAWPPEREAEAADLLGASGLHGVEVAPTAIWPRPLEVSQADIDRYREGWLERGIRIVATQALLFGQPDLVLFADEATRRRTADHLAGMARLSSRLGARAMVFGSPRNRHRGDRPMAEAMDLAVSFFRDLGPIVADLGTCLCIEGNAPAYGCDFLTSTAEAAELVRQVDHPGIRLQLDTSTMTMNGEDYVAAITTHVAVAGHFHASEPNLVPLGLGGTDHACAAGALRRAGYDGWVSIEMRADPDDVELYGVSAALRLARAEYAFND